MTSILWAQTNRLLWCHKFLHVLVWNDYLSKHTSPKLDPQKAFSNPISHEKNNCIGVSFWMQLGTQQGFYTEYTWYTPLKLAGIHHKKIRFPTLSPTKISTWWTNSLYAMTSNSTRVFINYEDRLFIWKPQDITVAVVTGEGQSPYVWKIQCCDVHGGMWMVCVNHSYIPVSKFCISVVIVRYIVV